MYSIHYGLYPLHNHTSPALKRVPLTFLQPPLRPFRLQSLQAIGSEASAKGGGLELCLGLASGKKIHWIGSRENGHLQEIIVFPQKRCFNCRCSVPKPLILDMAAMALDVVDGILSHGPKATKSLKHRCSDPSGKRVTMF